MGRLQYVQSVGGSDISENWINDDDLIVKMDEEDRMDDDLIVKMDEEDKAVQGTPNLEYFVKVHHIKSDGELDIHQNISLNTPLHEYLDVSTESINIYAYEPDGSSIENKINYPLKIDESLVKQGINKDLLDLCCSNKTIIIGDIPNKSMISEQYSSSKNPEDKKGGADEEKESERCMICLGRLDRSPTTQEEEDLWMNNYNLLYDRALDEDKNIEEAEIFASS